MKLGFQMALFSSSFKLPIPCHKFPRNYSIQRPLTSIGSITGTPCSGISKFSIAAATNTLSNNARFCSSLNSHVELEEEPPSSAIIFVKGLPQTTGEGGVKEAFSRFGEVSRVKMVVDKKSKQSLGFGYVWFTSEDDAQTAIEEMNGQFFEGRFIHVTLAKPGSCKTRPDPTPYKF